MTPESISAQINGQPATISPEGLIGELTYSCYRFNRQESPNATPESWAKIFGSTSAAMEERFQAELRAMMEGK